MGASQNDPELPGYTRRAPSVASRSTIAGNAESSCSLEDTKGRKWLSLFVKSRTPNPKSLPIFYERDVINGRVELDLKKSETIKAVTISVRPFFYDRSSHVYGVNLLSRSRLVELQWDRRNWCFSRLMKLFGPPLAELRRPWSVNTPGHFPFNCLVKLLYRTQAQVLNQHFVFLLLSPREQAPHTSIIVL
jgi:hypothetical protein